MQTKEIDLDKTIFELTDQYPELIEILAQMGFLGVKNPLIRNTLGRKTTLREGCKKQGKDLKQVVEELRKNGFTVKGV
ncbi:DUF1858 domain-containing protein [Thermotoga profunda]|uniref:DUF1858 domain-containing protein n=1 Tax=Thermotoga profunda TaxID=1508420 RepID=UPI00069492B4|nr:DUF1858 domain-containing protein [Thermotoga profunda]